jgi:hypothetical protein
MVVSIVNVIMVALLIEDAAESAFAWRTRAHVRVFRQLTSRPETRR